MRSLLLLLLVGLALPAPGARKPAKAQVEDGVDRLVVASVLLGDGHVDRALTVLEELDPSDPEIALDRGRYFLLRGLCRARLGVTEGAAEDFAAAIAAGNPEPTLWLHLAQAQVALGRFDAALESLASAGEVATSSPGALMLAARAYVGLERHAEAWTALRDGRARFPDEVGFDREALLLLVQLGLYREAAEVGARYLSARAGEIEAWLAVAEAHRRAGNLREAAALLEEARLRFPDRVDVSLRLARTYLDLGEPGACGQILAAAVPLDPALAAPAADCWRDAGQIDRALYLNTLVPEPADKARQRLDLTIRALRWEQAAALTPRLARLGLLDEDPIAYAVAYANFKLGRFDVADAQLATIADPRWFADATTLRRAMEDCRAQPIACW